MKIDANLRQINYSNSTKLELVGTNITLTGILGLTGALTASGDLLAGSLAVKAASGDGQVQIKCKTTDLTFSGGATEDFTGAIPKGVIVLGVSALVTTIIVATTGVSWSLGDGVDADLYGTSLPFAAGTHVDEDDWTASPLTQAWSASAGDLVATPNAGTLDTGVVRVNVYYIDVSAPTS